MELVAIQTRNNARALPLSQPARAICTVDKPGSCATVYVTEFSAPGRLTAPFVRLDLVAEMNNAKVRIASALLRLADLNRSDMVIAVSGFVAQRWHVEAQASDPAIAVGVGLGVGCGCGAPTVLVPPKYQQASSDTPAELQVNLPRAIPGNYRYQTGTGNNVITVPRGARVKSIFTIGGLAAGSLQITQGGIAGGAIVIPINTPFAEQFQKNAEDNLSGPVVLTFVNSASHFVSWWE